jgi:hypothetical protein
VSPPTLQLTKKTVQATSAVSRLGCRNSDLRLQLFERQCLNVVSAVNKRTTRATVMLAFQLSIPQTVTRSTWTAKRYLLRSRPVAVRSAPMYPARW